MNWRALGVQRMPAMCESCPFGHAPAQQHMRKSLAKGRFSEICQSVFQGFVFMCHKTTTHDDESSQWVPTEGDRECAGSIQFRDIACTNRERAVGRGGSLGERTMPIARVRITSNREQILACVGPDGQPNNSEHRWKPMAGMEITVQLPPLTERPKNYPICDSRYWWIVTEEDSLKLSRTYRHCLVCEHDVELD